MSQSHWLSDVQMACLKPFFPETPWQAPVGDRFYVGLSSTVAMAYVGGPGLLNMTNTKRFLPVGRVKDWRRVAI